MARSVIVSAVRTPFGRLGGGLARYQAPELGAIAIRAAVERAGVEPGEIEYVVMGEVLQAGVGQAPARQAAVGAGLPVDVPSDTINKVCASSIRAVQIADLMIRAGEHEVVVAGGMESMTNAPYALRKARFGYRMGDGTLVDLMTYDGLISTFDGLHMIEQASVVSRELGISREEQDAWALRSHERAVRAIDEGRFADEIVAVDGVEVDEGPRRDTSLERLAALKPVRDEQGTTTAGNAPGLNDGAGALVVTSDEFARKRGLEVLATIVGPGVRRGRVRVPRPDAGGRGREGAREGREDDRRRRAHRGQRGVLVGGAELDPAAGRRPGAGQRQRRRGRARASDRRVRRADPRDDGARAPAERRRARPGRDLLRRRPGRRAADRGLVPGPASGTIRRIRSPALPGTRSGRKDGSTSRPSTRRTRAVASGAIRS